MAESQFNNWVDGALFLDTGGDNNFAMWFQGAPVFDLNAEGQEEEEGGETFINVSNRRRCAFF